MRISMQIDDGDQEGRPTPSAVPAGMAEDGGAAPGPEVAATGTAGAGAEAVDAGPVPAHLLEALGDTPGTAAAPPAGALAGGPAPMAEE